MIGMVLQVVKRRALEIVLVCCSVYLSWQVYSALNTIEPENVPSLCNRDFPSTYIGGIHLNLTSPHQHVRLKWIGPDAAEQDSGPFRSSPGAGWGANDCNDPVESNCPDSRCTPKGLRRVEGFRDHLKDTPVHQYVTWIDKKRSIGFHSCPSVEPVPASAGCVRLEPFAARLIHDNSIEGVTEIVIDGTWTNPRQAGSREQGAGSKTESQQALVRGER
jgi:hypothetical protein